MDINDFNKVTYKKNDEDDEKSIINLNSNENIDSDDLNYNFSNTGNGLNSNFYPSIEFKAPPKRSELSSFINSPISKTLDTFSKLSKISLTKEDDRPTYDFFDKKNEIKPNQKFPPPSLPEIEVTSIIKKRSNLPLTLEDYNNKYKLKSKIFLFDKIFTSGIATNELRRQLWPILLGLMNNDDEQNWEPLKDLYNLYSNQWKSINLDQESRFTSFREKKSMAERDVIRCDRRHPYFQSEENLELLKDLLMSYVMYDFDTGYVQGMTDLAAPLLYIFEGDPVKSFWCFTRVLKLTKKNFEMTQLTVKNLLIKLFKLINLTDPCFAQYLSENESDNCYFAFRWLICLFKREFVKEDDYEQLLIVWDTLWAIDAYEKLRKEEAEKLFKKQENLIKNSHLVNDLINDTNKLNFEEKDESQTENYNEENMKNENDQPLTSFQLFFLALSLAIIRQERDYIFSQKLDASEIIKHFNTLKLNDCLNDLLNQATKIWCWLKYDGGEDQLYLEPMSNNNFDLLDD